jgi:predicted aspartyl protease
MPRCANVFVAALTPLLALLSTQPVAASRVEPPPPPAAIAALQESPIAPDLGSPSTDILALEEERHRRMTIPVTIAGAGPYNFLIDTGSQATAVTHHIDRALGLPRLGTAQLVGMASVRAVQLVEVNDLVVGSHTLHNISAPILNRTYVGADGIIGLDSLQDFRVLIDFRKETIVLQDITKHHSRSGFEIIVSARQKLGQLLITNAEVEGVHAIVIIDTGAQSSLGNEALRSAIRARRLAEVLTMDVNGVTLTTDLSLVKSLEIQGLKLANVSLSFADAPAFEVLGLKDTPVLSLGMQHLKIFDRVAIDFAKQRILFDVPRDVARAMRRAKRRNFVGSRR